MPGPHSDSHNPISEWTLGDLKQKVAALEDAGPGAPGEGVTDHGELTGLADDDHPQYVTHAEGDAAYAASGHDHDSAYAPLVHDHDGDYAPLDHEHSGEDITSGTIADARIPSSIARDTEVTAAIEAHTAAADPHPGYTTAAELSTAVSNHEAASNPHPTYLTQAEADALYDPLGGGGGGAPTGADYLVGTAQGGLSAEIVVGTSPGGELGGTWASPTVDASHSGSTHAAVQAAAEATAAGALASHVAAADPHTGYQRESEKDAANGYAGLNASGLVPASLIDAAIARDSEVTSAISTHEGAADPHTGYQKESEKGAASGYAQLDSGILVPVAILGTGTADNTKFLRGDRVWAVPAGGSAPAAASSTAGPVNVTTTAEIQLATVSLTTTAARKYLINASVRFTKDTGTTTRGIRLLLRRTNAAGLLLTESGGGSSAIASSPFGAALTYIDTPGDGAPFVWRLSAVNFVSATIVATLISLNVVELA
jgi:hypothetical protein